MRKKRRNHAVRNIILVTLAAILLIVSDVFFVAVGKVHLRSGTDLSVYADSANTVTESEQALRGNIYDRSGNVIAQDNRTYNIICILNKKRKTGDGKPAYVVDKEKTAKELSEILKIDQNKILSYLNQDVYQTELGTAGRNLTKSQKDDIDKLNLPGIEFTDSIKRVYPNNTFASNLIGYAQSDETGTTVGKMGLELYLDSYLRGTNGSRTYQVDKDGYVLPGMKEEVKSAVNGDNVYLTLDQGIQQTLETAFQTTAKTFHAQSIWGGAMEVKTGKVIAWGQYPSYDPNNLDNVQNYNNIGAQVPYEPGSTLKTFTWAATINEGKYNGSNTADGNDYCYVADAHNNPVRTSDKEDAYGCIYNAGRIQYGNIDLDHGMIYSLNTVAATLQNEYITPDIHLSYLKKFGFFQKVDTDGIPEEAGKLNFTWPGDKVSLSYGQGSTVTMLQLFQAYSAIFSDGTMVKPYFVESIRDPYDSSNIIYQAHTTKVGNPITAESAKTLQKIMYRVVNDPDGTAAHYQIPECKLIAKTGTTEVAINGSYNTNTTIASIMAAMPADNPQVLVYYAWEGTFDRTASRKTEAQVSFFRKVAQTYGFTNGDNSTDASAKQENTAVDTSVVTTMPDLLNHTVTYATDKLKDSQAQVITLGSGTNVIDQFPKSGSSVSGGQRVFLLTDTSSFAMPDLTGWTRKDVASLWAVTGFGFKLSGSGTVKSQSVPAGTVVTKGTEIQVVFG